MHSGGKATATELAECDICGVKYGELLKIEDESTDSTPESTKAPESSSLAPESSSIIGEPADDASDKTWLIIVVAAAVVIVAIGAVLAIKLSRKKK